MMPWRDQVALAWKFLRWSIWPPGMPLYGQFSYKAGQALCIIAWSLGSAWIFAAGLGLVIAAGLS
jgi:hypothetical protein